jgi:hypothetical protein
VERALYLHLRCSFNQFGDMERCALRTGNVHNVNGWKDVLEPVVRRYRSKVSRLYFRADVVFANPGVCVCPTKPNGSSMRSGFRPTALYRIGSATW